MKNLLQQLNWIEEPLCHAMNQRGEVLSTQHFFRIISRLGDGIVWYTIMMMLPIFYGTQGLLVSMQMLVVGIVSVALYKSLKVTTLRERPCDFFEKVKAHGPRLDHYSFPSGHTMHAVGFTAVIMGHFPMLGLLITPFTLLIASSRLVLGLHYPSDIVAGSIIGGGIAWASFQYLI